MSDRQHNATEFNVLQLSANMELAPTQKWIVEITHALHSLGVTSIIPGRIGRSEPVLRRYGGNVIDEPLDEDMRRGAVKRIISLARRKRVHAVIAYDLAMLAIASKLFRALNLPVIFVTNALIPHPPFYQLSAVRSQLKSVSLFIVPSQMVAFHLQDRHGIARERIVEIREGVDTQAVSFEKVSQERTASLAHSWGVIDDVVDLVLIPANFEDAVWCKQVYRLAQYLHKVGQIPARFIVVGDDDGSGELRNLSSQILNRAPFAHIDFVGHCGDIEAAMKLSSLILFLDCPTQASFPLALIAQSLGRYVIMPEGNSAAGDFIHVGHSGKLVPADMRVVVGEVISALNMDASSRNAAAMAGRIFVSQYFSRENMHKEVQAIFSEPVSSETESVHPA